MNIHQRLMQLQDSAEETAITVLNNLNVEDPERAHGQADETLLAFLKEAGFEEVATAYNRVSERATWWGAG